MPLGNLTSQFFANVYLDELDQFVKHKLKVKYYVRYVDDFVILHNSKERLNAYKSAIDCFLKEKLAVQLHPDKTRIFLISQGTAFLGLRIFAYHKLLKKNNIKKFERKLKGLCAQFDEKKSDYDKIYDFLEGWVAYSRQANAYALKNRILKTAQEKFASEFSTKEYNRYLKLLKTSH